MTGPELTAHTDGNPWVEVFFDPADLDPAATTLRVYRYADNRTWLVRGGVDIAPGVTVTDFEIPFQREVVYKAEQFGADGVSLGFTDSSTMVMDVTGTFVHQPLVPSLFAQMRLSLDSAASLVRRTPGAVVYIEGATVGRRIGTRRQGLTGVPVSFFADSLATADAMQDLLGAYETAQVPVVCIRTSSNVRWPGTFFASTEDFAEKGLTVHLGGGRVRFDAQMDEVAPPFPGLLTPLLTYDDLDAAFPTYSARDAFFGTYTAQDRAFEYAGYATGGA